MPESTIQNLENRVGRLEESDARKWKKLDTMVQDLQAIKETLAGDHVRRELSPCLEHANRLDRLEARVKNLELFDSQQEGASKQNKWLIATAVSSIASLAALLGVLISFFV